MDNTISWKIDSSKYLINDNTWSDIPIIKKSDYYITTNSVDGFNFLYITLPKKLRFSIYNKLNFMLYDSALEDNQLFLKIHENDYFLTLRKRDVYNTHNPVTFKITIYND